MSVKLHNLIVQWHNDIKPYGLIASSDFNKFQDLNIYIYIYSLKS